MYIKFRKYKVEDQDEFSQMVIDFYKEVPTNKHPNQASALKTINELTTFTEKGQIILFEQEGVIIGYSILIFFWSNEYGGNFVNIDELYVKEEFRSQGIAQQFFEHLKETPPKHAVALQLEVSPKNTKAHDLYQKMGFEPHENIVLDFDLNP